MEEEETLHKQQRRPANVSSFYQIESSLVLTMQPLNKTVLATRGSILHQNHHKVIPLSLPLSDRHRLNNLHSPPQQCLCSVSVHTHKHTHKHTGTFTRWLTKVTCRKTVDSLIPGERSLHGDEAHRHFLRRKCRLPHTLSEV